MSLEKRLVFVLIGDDKKPIPVTYFADRAQWKKASIMEPDP